MTFTRPTKASLVMITILFAAGCGGGSSSPTQPSATSAPAPAPVIQATLSSIQANVFTPRCSSCHSGSTAEAGLRLTAGDAYANLVGVASTQRGLMRVAPNDSENSYLIHKVEGRGNIVGHQMPPPPLLSSADIQAIRRWIDQGARND